MDIWIQNPSNTVPGINVDTQGSSHAAAFNISNASNTMSALHATTGGTGAAIQAQTSTGFTAIYGRREGATNGNAGLFDITDAANSYPALQVNTIGTGSAGNFEVNNPSSTAPALFSQSNGVGPAFSADHTGGGNAVHVVKTGSGGNAANFQISNTGNTAAAVYARSSTANGYAIEAGNVNNGRALSLFQGGMQVSTYIVPTGGGEITVRAIAYEISDGSSYEINFSTEGDMFFIYNSYSDYTYVNSVGIQPNTGNLFINIGGNLRAF